MDSPLLFSFPWSVIAPPRGEASNWATSPPDTGESPPNRPLYRHYDQMQVEYKCYVMPWMTVSLSLGARVSQNSGALPKKFIILRRQQKKNMVRYGLCYAKLVVRLLWWLQLYVLACVCVPNILILIFRVVGIYCVCVCVWYAWVGEPVWRLRNVRMCVRVPAFPDIRTISEKNLFYFRLVYAFVFETTWSQPYCASDKFI